MTIIRDPLTADTQRVDEKGRALTFSTTRTDILSSAFDGGAYNINTGEIRVTADSAILFFQNGEESDFIIDSVAIGMTVADDSDIQKFTFLRNPSAGTIVDNAVNVANSVNRNFGSARTNANSMIYRGASGDTITDGTDIGVFYAGVNGRLFANVGFILEKGNSFGITMDVNLTSGDVGVYAAIIGHFRASVL